MNTINLADIAVGDHLPPLYKPPVTLELLRRYAEASGDFKSIHLDEEATRHLSLDSVIAHGMLSMAFLGQFLSLYVPDVPSAHLARLQVRFQGMVRLGDALTCYGIVQAHHADQNGHITVTIECWVRNQRGEKVTEGEAVVVLSPRENSE
jgi:acyl dehydratase